MPRSPPRPRPRSRGTIARPRQASTEGRTLARDRLSARGALTAELMRMRGRSERAETAEPMVERAAMPAPRAPAARYASCPGSWSRWNCGHSFGQRHVAPKSSSKRYSSRLGRSAMLSSARMRGVRARARRGGAVRAGARWDSFHQHRQVHCARGRPERVHDRAMIWCGRRATSEGALSGRVVTVDADGAAADPAAPRAQCQPNCEHFEPDNLSIPPLAELPCARWQAMRQSGHERVKRCCPAVTRTPAVPTPYTRRARRCKPRRQDSAACPARPRE